MTRPTPSPGFDDEIVDPKTWADEDRIHELLTWLRANDPVRYLEPEGYDPFWAITKHADLMEIERRKSTFVNDPRPTLAPSGMESVVREMTGGRKHLIRSLVQMDDPDHFRYRKLTQGWFLQGNIRKLQASIEALASEYVDRLAELGGECDFVKDISIWYPLRVIMSVLGIPPEDEPIMLKLTQELFGANDPDVRRSFEPGDIIDVVRDFENYFAGISQDRRRNPRDDLATVIAQAEIEGAPLPPLESNGYFMIIATAGHDTTSSTTSGGLLALLQDPEQFAKLASDPDAYLPSAVDEMVRWVTPVRHFMRTATADCEIRDRTIRAGESVILWYPSANRDEEVFDNPFEFDISRPPKQHIAFGYGAHVCLGQHLARLEINLFYRELLKRVKHIELAGEPKYMQSTFVGGLKSLPIRYELR